MRLHNIKMKPKDIAALVKLGESTISRIIIQSTPGKVKPRTYRERCVVVSVTKEDHAIIAEYAKVEGIPMHEALHSLLHDARSAELVDVIKREVAVIMKAAKTEVAIIKKKWWQL